MDSIISMMNIFDYIKLLDFFKLLDDDAHVRLSAISQIRQYPKGSVLYYEDDANDKIFFLVEGLLKTYKVDRCDNEIFLRYIYNNRLITEISSLNNHEIHCYANTEFVEDSVVLEINYELFKKHFIQTGLLTDNFIEEIANHTRELHCILNRELIFDATARVAHMLSNNLERFNKFKRHEVSTMLNIQPETLSRILTKLKQKNIIEFDKTDIIIIDEGQLQNTFTGNNGLKYAE